MRRSMVESEVTVNKTLLRKGFILGAHYSGLCTLAAPLLQGQGSILMLHRIGPCSNGLCINGFLSVQPEFLDRMIGALKRDGLKFCSMDEVVDRVKAGHSDERYTAITLDDGYKDNLYAGAPIFEAHDVPYTVFVSPGLTEGTAHLWWDNLAHILEKQDRITFATSDGPGAIDCRTASEKRAAYNKLMTYLCNDVDERTQRRFVDDLCRAYGLDPKAYARQTIMNWDELRRINQSPLCTLGAHTINHYHLARLEEDEARFEMEQSAKVIEIEIGERPEHFAYPYGAPIAAGRREARLAKEIGFKSAVTTRHGTLHHKHHSDTLHALPRISVNGNFQRLPYMRSLLRGIAIPFANGGKRVVTM